MTNTDAKFTTEEGNALIAGFLGYTLKETIFGEEYFNTRDYLVDPGTITPIKLKEDALPFGLGKIKKMRFHEDWTWLMLVVERVKKLIDEKDYPHGVGGGVIPVAEFYDLPIHAPITDVWTAVVNFIDWYNHQTTYKK